MIKVRIKAKNPFSTAEKFFFEKSLELLSNNTIDTYRLRINNPKTILSELVSVIESVNKGSLREIYIDILCAECLELIKQENELNFKSITKGFFIQALVNKKYDVIFYASNIILSDNIDYIDKIFSLIKSEIKTIDANGTYGYLEFDSLNRYIQYYYIELRKYGYNKPYLYNFIIAVFGGKKQLDSFQAGIDIISTLINRKPELFQVFCCFSFEGNGEELMKRETFQLISISIQEIEIKAKSINKEFEEYVKSQSNHSFFYLELEAIDYYTAGLFARKKIQHILDNLCVASDIDIFKLNPVFFVVGSKDPSRAKSQKVTYKLDGHFVPNLTTYNIFLEKYDKLSTNNKIENVTLKKIFSTLRYLRYGTLAEEQEHKLLNYWIAIEYLFSSVKHMDSKTSRLNEYLYKIHCNTYTRRLFFDLHKSIKLYKLEPSISNFDNTNLEYLLNPVTANEIDKFKNRYPLLNFRFNTTIIRFKDSQSIMSDLKRHSNNVNWNLTRIYRTRNEIVHSAATDIDVVELASHLKYFLIFTLNSLFNFLLDSPIDTNDDRNISIEDFFLVESIKYDSLVSNNSITPNQLINLINPIEYLH